jgi:hypothetical protein
MHSRFWFRRLALAAVWGLVTSTWTSIGHYLLGLPDIGLLAVGTVCALTLAWPWIATTIGHLAANANDAGLVKHSAFGKTGK